MGRGELTARVVLLVVGSVRNGTTESRLLLTRGALSATSLKEGDFVLMAGETPSTAAADSGYELPHSRELFYVPYFSGFCTYLA